MGGMGWKPPIGVTTSKRRVEAGDTADYRTPTGPLDKKRGTS